MLQNDIREKFGFSTASVRGYDSIQDVERSRNYPEVTVDNDDDERLLYSSLEPKNYRQQRGTQDLSTWSSLFDPLRIRVGQHVHMGCIDRRLLFHGGFARRVA